MFLVGLTGGIGSGKSTVSNKLRSLGAIVIDADEIARKIVQPGKKAWKKIKKEFPNVITDSGEIDRAKLGEIIFSEVSKRKLLNRITHPEIYKQMFWEVLNHFFKGVHFVVLDLPLLYESEVVLDYVYKVIVVRCDEEQQIERLQQRNNMCRNDALIRIKAQMPLEDKCKQAHFVINNSLTIEDTDSQVEAIHKLLTQSNHHWRLRVILILFFLFLMWLIGFLLIN